jgi:hypothetical protein
MEKSRMGIKALVAASTGGARGAKFPEVGTVVGGTVISADVIQSRDEDGELEFWDDGNEKQKVRIIVQTDLDEGVDDQGREDDGKRAIYVKWWGAQKRALIEALVKAEAEDVETGGEFWAKFQSEGERIKRAWSPTKEMRYRYKNAPVVKPSDFDDEDDAPAPVKAPAAKAAPAKKPAAKAAPEKDETVAALDAAGLDDF